MKVSISSIVCLGLVMLMARANVNEAASADGNANASVDLTVSQVLNDTIQVLQSLQTVTRLPASVVQRLGSIVNTLNGALNNIGDDATKTTSNVIRNVTSTLNSLAGSASTTVRSVLNEVEALLDGIPSTVSDSLNNAINNALSQVDMILMSGASADVRITTSVSGLLSNIAADLSANSS